MKLTEIDHWPIDVITFYSDWELPSRVSDREVFHIAYCLIPFPGDVGD